VLLTMPDMIPLRLRNAALLLLLLSGLPVRAAPALKAGYSLEDAGQVRTFETVAGAGGVVLYETGRARKVSARRMVTPEGLMSMKLLPTFSEICAPLSMTMCLSPLMYVVPEILVD